MVSGHPSGRTAAFDAERLLGLRGKIEQTGRLLPLPLSRACCHPVAHVEPEPRLERAEREDALGAAGAGDKVVEEHCVWYGCCLNVCNTGVQMASGSVSVASVA